MFDRASEYVAHFIVTMLTIVLGSVIGACLIAWASSTVAMHYIGNFTTMLTDLQMAVTYGVSSIVLVHFATRGWWYGECMHLLQELEDLHQLSLDRMSSK